MDNEPRYDPERKEPSPAEKRALYEKAYAISTSGESERFPSEDPDIIDADGQEVIISRKRFTLDEGGAATQVLAELHMSELLIRYTPPCYERNSTTSYPERIQILFHNPDTEDIAVYFLDKNEFNDEMEFNITTESSNYINIGYDTETGKIKTDITTYDENTVDYTIPDTRPINQYEALKLRGILMAIE